MLPKSYLKTPEGTRLGSNPQSHHGGADRDRTDDLYNAIVALSQLSYSPNIIIIVILNLFIIILI